MHRVHRNEVDFVEIKLRKRISALPVFGHGGQIASRRVTQSVGTLVAQSFRCDSSGICCHFLDSFRAELVCSAIARIALIDY